MRQEALRRLVADFVAAHTDLGLERLDGEEVSYEQMLGSVRSLPFLAARKLIVLRAPGANKDFVEHFEQFPGEVAETNDVVLVEPKLDKRLTYYKQLQKHTEFHDFKLLDGPELVRYLVAHAKEQGGSLTSGDARLLIDRVGTDQLTLLQEIDKLLMYDPHVSRSSIETLTELTPQSNIFELLEAAFAGDGRRALRLYKEQRTLQVESMAILAMLIWQLHVLAIVKTAAGKSAETVAREAKLSPYTVRKTQNLARRISLVQLRKLVSELRTFDVRLKSEALNADEVVQYYLLSLGMAAASR